MKNGITLFAMIFFVTSCVSSFQNPVVRNDAPREVVSQLPASITALDFSKSMTDTEVLSKLGLLEWVKTLEFQPGMRHTSFGYSLDEQHLLELHTAGIREDAIIGVTLFREGKAIATKMNRKLAVGIKLEETCGVAVGESNFRGSAI